MSTSMLTTIQTHINFYVYPTVMVVGIIGNLFILLLFNRQRHNACSIYLVNSAVTNLLHLPSTYFLKTFYVTYNDKSMSALIVCKLSNYVPSVLGLTTRTILIWACIDRFMTTSHRANFRAFSTPKRAKYLVFFTYIFWSVASIHTAILNVISKGQCVRVGIYVTIYTLYAILFIGLIPSVVLSIFAYLIHRNMKHLRSRVQPINQGVNNTNHIIQRRDRDLLVLVIAEVIVYVITTVPFPAVLLETLISQYVLPTKTLSYFLTEIFTLYIAVLILYIFSAAPFYIYMFSSASFRRDCQQLMMVGYRKLRRTAPNQPTSRTHQTVMRQETRV